MSDTGLPLAAPSTQDAVALVRDDHAAIGVAFDTLLAALHGEASEADRQGLLSRVALRLRAHGQIEREFLYPALRSAASDGSEAEHAAFEKALETISAMKPPMPQHSEAIKTLAADVERHFADEEATLLPAAASGGVDLLALGTQMALRRGVLLADLGVD